MVIAAAGPSQAAGRCADLSFAEQGACWQKLLTSQTRQMRQSIEARIGRIGPDDLNDAKRFDSYVESIRRAQTAWEAYRDAECSQLDFVMRRHIGEAIDGCKADLNEKRLEELRRGVGP